MVAMERALSAKGVAVTTLTTDDDGSGRRLSEDAQPARSGSVTRVYCHKWFDFYKVAPGILPWLWRHVRAFDVVHIHALFSFTSIVAALTARCRGVPYIVRPLGTLNDYGMTRRRPWLKRLSFAALEGPIVRAAAAMHFTSEAERIEAEALGVPLRSVVVPLPVDEGAQGDSGELMRLHPELRGRRVVLYLSRLDPKKNIESLIEAFSVVRTRFDNVTLAIAGDGSPSYVERLKTLATVSALEAEVVWLGHVDGAKKAALFAAAAVFVLPSYSENFGIAAAEAMQAGVPCILSKGVAIAQQAQEAGAALVVEPTPIEIVQALDHLLRDEAHCRIISARARGMAQREFSADVMADRLSTLYQRITTFKTNK